MKKLLRRRAASFGHAFRGLGDLFATQVHARIHAVAGGVAVGLGFYLKISPGEWCLVVLSIAAVLAAEAMNTAIEYWTDLVSPEHHPLAGKAKDVAAAAVLLTAIGAAIVGGIIFLPKLLANF